MPPPTPRANRLRAPAPPRNLAAVDLNQALEYLHRALACIPPENGNNTPSSIAIREVRGAIQEAISVTSRNRDEAEVWEGRRPPSEHVRQMQLTEFVEQRPLIPRSDATPRRIRAPDEWVLDNTAEAVGWYDGTPIYED